jgi:hypothetical protein
VLNSRFQDFFPTEKRVLFATRPGIVISGGIPRLSV